MKNFLLIAVSTFIWSGTLFAQVGDTITVQTLEFTDITKRRGWYVLPPDTSSFSKILMYYTLKCDAQTTQDGYACGEWDYTTYTNLNKPRNIGDTIFWKGASQPDTIFYGNTNGFDVYRKKQYQNVIDNTVSETEVVFNSSGVAGTAILGTEKTVHTQFIFLASDLTSMGLVAGNIDRIKLSLVNGNSNVGDLTLRAKNSLLTELTPLSMEKDNFTEIFSSNYSTISGFNIFNLTQPFLWDGSSNIVIDLSHTSHVNNLEQTNEVTTVYNSGLTSGGDNRFLAFSNDDYVQVPASALASLNNEITVSLWCYGNPDKMPMNSYIFEGRDANGNRVVNSHLPWSNSEVYWDCGNAGTGGYDRVNALANISDFAGKWNHWAFTKNAVTGSMKIYLNGTLFTSGTGKTMNLSTITNFKIGGNATTGMDGIYEGNIDEFRIWDKELTQQEIQEYMFHSVDGSHPQIGNLLVAYNFNEEDQNLVLDYSGNGADGELMGLPQRRLMNGSDNYFDMTQLTILPEISFYQGVYASHLDSTIVQDTVMHSMFTVVKDLSFLDLNVTGISTTRVDTIYHYEPDYSFIYDENGNKFDSIAPFIAGYYVNTVSSVTHQIQNYVTPYGIGLNLNGAAGFRYVYDVTDYEPILHDTIEFMAGNQQELIDVKFLFIKGTPPREVVNFQTLALGDYQHADIANDVVLKAVSVDLNSSASQFVVRTRTTGHWFGGFQNCAEFCPKNHNIKVNGTQTHQWLNWKKCASNPIKSQGGTWVYDRAGWCPGSFADTYDHDISNFVTPGATASIDYGMETTAGGMEGNYRTTVQLFEYSTPSFQNDARIEDILSPNDWEWHQNYNPMCDNPKILIRNTGADDVQTMVISYWVCGGPREYYTWTGNLSFMDTATVVLPIPNQTFWYGAQYCKLFNTEIMSVNGVEDDYVYNNSYQSSFETPPSIPGDLILWYKTNSAPQENELHVYDDAGNAVYSRTNANANTQYKDTVALTPGCYKLVLTDTGEDGLSFFANTAQGSGSLILRKVGGGTLKSFDADFGSELIYYFTSGFTVGTEELEQEVVAKIFPNPNNGLFQLETDGFIGNITLEVFNSLGEKVKVIQRYADAIISKTEVDLMDLPTGYYMMTVKDDLSSKTIQVVKN